MRKPTHPGLILKEEILSPLKLSVSEAAQKLDVPPELLSELINEKAALSPDMAVRIAKATRTSPSSWLSMQTKLDLWISQQKQINVSPFNSKRR